MRRITNLARRFAASKRGIAAVEFAFILPVMLVILLGSFDGARVMSVYMKVRAATAVLGDISNQYTTIHDADMAGILGATSAVLSPYPSAPVVVTISQLQVTSSGHAKVSWSSTLNGTARTVGSTLTIPTAFTNSYLIFCELSYTYTPVFGFFLSHSLTLSDNLYTTPRTGASITRTSP